MAVAVALAAAARQAPLVIVDLSGLSFIDASGVAALARGWRHARDAGGDLQVAAQEQVRKMLDLIAADGDFSAPPHAVRPVKPQDVPTRRRRPDPATRPCARGRRAAALRLL